MSKTQTMDEITRRWRRQIRAMDPSEFRYEFRAMEDLQGVLLSFATNEQLRGLYDFDLEDALASDDPDTRAEAERALPKACKWRPGLSLRG